MNKTQRFPDHFFSQDVCGAESHRDSSTREKHEATETQGYVGTGRLAFPLTFVNDCKHQKGTRTSASMMREGAAWTSQLCTTTSSKFAEGNSVDFSMHRMTSLRRQLDSSQLPWFCTMQKNFLQCSISTVQHGGPEPQAALKV